MTDRRDTPALGFLRSASLLATGAGGVGAIALTLSALNRSLIVLVLGFALWVGAPFAILAWAIIKSKSWPSPTQMVLYLLAILNTAGTIAIFGHFVAHPRPAQPAAPFVLIPVASVVLIALFVGIPFLTTRRKTS